MKYCELYIFENVFSTNWYQWSKAFCCICLMLI